MTLTKEKMDELLDLYESAWGEGNLDAPAKYVVEDWVGHYPYVFEDLHGVEDYKNFIARFQEGFSNIDLTVEDRIVEGNKAVIRNRFAATHDGEFMGIPPTGTEVEITSMIIARIEDGLVAESWVEFDLFGMMEQLGLTFPRILWTLPKIYLKKLLP